MGRRILFWFAFAVLVSSALVTPGCTKDQTVEVPTEAPGASATQETTDKAASEEKAPALVVDTIQDVIDAQDGTCQGLVASDLPGPNGRISLREALCAARHDPNVRAVTFGEGLSGTIRLDWNLPPLDCDRIEIRGPDRGGIHLAPDRPGVPYALEVNSARGGSVRIAGLAFTGFSSSPVMIAPGSEGDVSFEDCLFDGNGVGMALRGSHVNLNRCRFVHNREFGVFVEGDFNTIQGCELLSNGSVGEHGGAGIFLQGRGNVIRECRIEGTIGKVGFNHGIFVKDGRENLIAGNLFKGNYGDAVCLVKSGGNRIESNTIRADSPQRLHADAIHLESGSTGNTVSENTILEAFECGIHLTSSSNNTVRKNTISETGSDGVLVDSSPGMPASADNLIQGNSIAAAGRNGVGFQSADASLERNNVSKNQIERCLVGVSVDRKTRTLTVSENRIRACGTGIALLQGTSGVTVSGNLVSESDGNGLMLRSDEEIVLRDNQFRGNKGWGIRLECRRRPEGLESNVVQENSLGSIENLSMVE